MAESRHITLRELQRRVKQTLDERFALPVWVAAEVSEVKVNYSGHCYLELVEKGGANGVPTAQARAVIWASNYSRIAGRFEIQTGQRLAAGIQILCKVLVTYHELYGFSLQITDIDPSYTLGDMERQRQQTIRQLHEEGVWEMNRQCSVPLGIQRIAIISSANAAGYRDFCQELEKSPYRFHLTLFDAFMQGAAAEESIIEALCAVADTQEQFDVVAIIRGGGSTSDLNCFNAYRLSNHIAQFPLPVITGIGHDKDTSVVDMVAHTALKTPTAVAGWLVETLDRLDANFQYTGLQLREATTSRTHTAEMLLERLSGDLKRLAGECTATTGNRLTQLAPEVARAARELLMRQQQRLDNAAAIAAAHTPERLLKLGFALLHSGSRAVVSAADVQGGDHLEIELSDGSITATVNNTTIWQKKR